MTYDLYGSVYKYADIIYIDGATIWLSNIQLCTLNSWYVAIHFNENSQRTHAVTKKGDKRYDIIYIYPKYKKGGHVVQKVLVDATYSKMSP